MKPIKRKGVTRLNIQIVCNLTKLGLTNSDHVASKNKNQLTLNRLKIPEFGVPGIIVPRAL